MKKKLTVTLTVVIALLAVGAGVALANLSKGAAAERMIQLAHWKAACGQGYWTCDTIALQGPYGPGKHDPEWKGTVIVVRHHAKRVSHQTCVAEVELNANGSTHLLTIDCEYALV